jgi:hypothetical protein
MILSSSNEVDKEFLKTFEEMEKEADLVYSFKKWKLRKIKTNYKFLFLCKKPGMFRQVVFSEIKTRIII